MTSNSLRSFAGGLILAAVVLGAVYFFGPSEATGKQAAETPTEDEMKMELASKGYVIHTEDEWKNQLAAAEKKAASKAAETKSKEPVKNDEEKATNENVKYKTILSVSSGMTSIEIGKILEETKIVSSSAWFANEVDKRGLANKLRPGVYELESGMSIDEIIHVIFK